MQVRIEQEEGEREGTEKKKKKKEEEGGAGEGGKEGAGKAWFREM
jgi:hypothetical protein